MHVALLVLLVAILLVVLYVAVVLRGRGRLSRHAGPGPWQVTTHTLSDGTLVISVRQDPEHERVVAEVPPGLHPTDLALELRDARTRAQAEADALNRA